MSCWTQNWCFKTLNIQPMGQWVSTLYSSVNIGTVLSARCGLTYPLYYLPLLRETCLVILDNNKIMVAFVVTNVILNSIFSQISPIGSMEEIIMSHPGLIPILLPIPIMLPTQIQVTVSGYLKTDHPGLIPIPILPPTQIQIQIQIQIQTQVSLKTLHQHPYGSTFIHLASIRS